MRITLIGAFPPQQKGEAHYLGRYFDALHTLDDANVSIVSQYETAPSVEEYEGVPLIRAIQDRSKSGTSYAPQVELVEAVLRTKPDVAHIHYGPGPDYGGRLGEALVPALRKLRKAGVRSVMTLHSIWLPEDVRDQARRLGAPGFVHPLIVAYFGRFMRRLRQSLDAELCLVSSDSSPMTRKFASAYGVRNLKEEVHATEPRIVPFHDTADPHALAFGFLRPDKGFDLLIEAFAAHVAAGGRGRLSIVGRPQSSADEPYARRLTEIAAQVPEGRCTVEVRYLSDDELERRLREADAIVVPYLRNVGASGPLHHALGVGKAVICSDAGHNAALRGSLEVFPSGDVRALTVSLGRVLNDETYRKKLSESAAMIATERSWTKLAEQNRALYLELLNK